MATAGLYHLIVWLDEHTARDRTRFVLFAVAAMATYYPAALMIPLAALAMLIYRRRPGALATWLIAGGVVAIVATSVVLLPQHWARHAPSPLRLIDGKLWRFYFTKLIELGGPAWIALGAAGVVLLVLLRWPRRRELAWLAGAFPVAIACLTVLPAESERYALPLVPLLVMAAVIGCTTLAARLARASLVAAATVLALVGLAAWSGLSTVVPVVAGFDRVAAYLREHGREDAVLYAGYHDGVFTYYVRAGDPDFEQRVVLAHRLISRFEQTPIFTWQETMFAETPAEVVALIQQRCGCRWIATEIGVYPTTAAERLLRQALSGPEFEHVASFAVAATYTERVELYRFVLPTAPPPSVDLVFPSFSGRAFRDVRPVQTRR
jgi:hypothetical protein